MNKQTLLIFAAALPLLAQPVPVPVNPHLARQDPSPKHLIAFMGDSFASGEGAPQSGSSKWAAENCHRSELNGRFRVAEILGALVPSRILITPTGTKTIDDFQVKDVSCSGATITSGIVGPYTGVDRMRPEGPGPNADLKPQIEQVETWMKAAPRNRQSIDTLVISIGGNDVGFAKIMATCMDPTKGDCDDDGSLQTLMNIGNPYGGSLIGYSRLRQAFIDMDSKIREKLNPKRILLVAYPNGTRDEFGKLCDRFDEDFSLLPVGDAYVPSIGPLGGATVHVKASESAFIESELIGRVNRERKDLAAELGWQFVDIQQFTKTHGFCAAKPWFNTPKASWNKQEDFNGTAHPNSTGYKVYEHFLLREVAKAHDIRLTRAVSGTHEQFSYILTKRSGGSFTGNLTDFFGGYPYTLMYNRNFTAQMKYLLNPNPSVFTEIRLEVSSVDFAFNPAPADIRVIAPATGLDQEGMLRADFSTSQYGDNDLIFTRWRFKTVPFWNTAAAPTTSYSSVVKYRVHGIIPLMPAE
jgi:hypothetical protein